MADFMRMRNKQNNPFLKLNDRLRQVLKNQSDIHVSTIILVGDQSNGKTSVVEGLTELRLPRGTNIQTRAPTELRIKSVDSLEKESYSVSYTKDDQTIVKDFVLEEMETTIRAAQIDLIGNEDDITDHPIIVNINKLNQEELTIIDLPGITRALLKTQHNDVEGKILNIYRKYMKPEETIIVNVVSAMVDFTTSASLKLSNEYDSKTERTIVCITKIDQHKERGLRDKINYGLKALNINSNNLFLIRNRTQEEIRSELSIEEARDRENALFSENEELRDFPRTMKGIKALSKKLVSIQEIHVTKIMFKNKNKLIKMREQLISEKNRLGRPYTNEYECITVLQQRFRDIFDEFQKHYLCLAETETCFEEYKFCRGKDDKCSFEFMAFDSVQINCDLNNVIEPTQISIRNDLPCGLTIEIRSDNNYYIKRNETNKSKEHKYDIKGFVQPFFIKIIVSRSKAVGNIFNLIWKKEHKLSQDLCSKYSLSYFFNPDFLDFIFKETRLVGQGFGLTSPSTERIAESTLKNHILPSHCRDSEQYIENISDINKKLYMEAIKNNFEDTAILKNHLLVIVDKYFDKLCTKSFKFYKEIFEWVESCAFNNDATYELWARINFYIKDFVAKHKQLIDQKPHSDIPMALIEKPLECSICRDLVSKGLALPVSPISGFDLHTFVHTSKLHVAITDNSKIVQIAFIIWTQWQVITQTLWTLIKQLSRNFFINKPLKNLQNALLCPDNFKEYSLKDLMKADENIERRRSENFLALAVVEEILNEIKLLDVRMNYGGFTFDE